MRTFFNIYRIGFIVFIFSCLCTFSTNAQSPKAFQLQEKVNELNNSMQYEKSQEAIQKFLNQPDISNDDRYHAYLYLSFTYKRLFDYESVIQYLDNALSFGITTPQKEYYENNIKCQKALAYFDIREYDKADSLMTDLASQNYKHINEEYKAKLFMQEGYLLYLENKFNLAEKKYDVAAEKMRKSSICDLPMIYGKKIELYGSMKDINAMYITYNKSMISSDSCNIIKYAMYSNESMSTAFAKMGNYKEAYLFDKKLDSLSKIYNQNTRLKVITELEKKYESEKKEQQIILEKEKVRISETRIVILVILLILFSLGGFLYLFWRRGEQLKQLRLTQLFYTKQIFENIEQERKRIAADLHDSIGHELLSIKTEPSSNIIINDRIDEVINELRGISRNLHPVLFESIGFKNSIENLFERLEAQNKIIIMSEINYNNELSIDAELQMYRIIQEAFSNVIKYSETHAVKFTIDTKTEYVILQIMDSGKGFDVRNTLQSGKAFGLHSIILRSQALGGETDIQSNSKKTIVEVKIPIIK